jgi:hypothetical protein
MGAPEPAGVGEVRVEARDDAVQVGEELGVGGLRLEPLLVDVAQQDDRVVVDVLPQVAVELSEQRPGIGLPRPEQVAGELVEARERRGWAGGAGR